MKGKMPPKGMPPKEMPKGMPPKGSHRMGGMMMSDDEMGRMMGKGKAGKKGK